MALRRDPQGSELLALQQICGAQQRPHVLEVGCGDGRMTWRYAAQVGRVTGIDANPEKIARAQAATPSVLAGKVEFLPLKLEDFAPLWRGAGRRRFDRAILAWSL